MSEVLKITGPVMRYHGAKYRLASWVMLHFPEHRCYVEPFGGAGGVLIQKERSYSEVFNDLDGEVVNLFQVLRNPESNSRLRELCALTPYHRDEFLSAFEPTTDPVEQARRMVVRATMGFGSASATAGTSGFRTDTKRKYATAQHLWANYPDNLAAVGMRLQGILIENKPAVEVMKKHDGIDTLHYCDPPYLPETRVKGNRNYRYEMTSDEHSELLECVKQLTGMVVVSGYDSELYNDTLAGWRRAEKSSRISAGRGTKVRQECLWISPTCDEALEQTGLANAI